MTNAFPPKAINIITEYTVINTSHIIFYGVAAVAIIGNDKCIFLLYALAIASL